MVGDPPQAAAVVARRDRTSRRTPRPPLRRAAGGCRCGSSSRRLAARAAIRSRPMPVSMFLLGSGRRLFGGSPTRLNCVKTRFQISTSLAAAGVDRRSRCTGRRRRRGPWLGAPAGQKLSSSPIRSMRLGRQADLVVPDAVRLRRRRDRPSRVSRSGSRPSHFLLGQELPGPVDRVALEVVAEAEVAQHLEERVVVGRAADVVDVAGAQALLAGRGARELELAPCPGSGP